MQLCFLAGVGRVGGNKVVVQPSGGKVILLDFGWDFKVDAQYLDEFIRPRDGRALVDLLTIGMLPRPEWPLWGAYRHDLFTHCAGELCGRFGFKEEDLEKPPLVGHVILSHGHADHVGLVLYLHEKIQVACGATTKLVLEYYEDVFPPGSMFTGILSYRPMFQLSDKGSRRFSGYDEVTRPLTVLPASRSGNIQWTLLRDSACEVAFFETDHSIPGAGAFLLRDAALGGKISYTGDIRFHGPFAKAAQDFVAAATVFHPDALICEGTAVGSTKEGPELPTEADVSTAVAKILREVDLSKMVFVDFAPRDAWRAITLYRAALDAGRTLVLAARTYHLLHKLVEGHVAGCEGVDLEKVRVLLPRKGWGIYDPQDYSYAMDIQAVFQPPGEKVEGDRTPKYKTLRIDTPIAIRADEIKAAPSKYIVQTGPYQWFDIVDLAPPAGSYYILSKSDPAGEEGEDVAQQRDAWLRLLGIPPDQVFTAHCSGHARVPDLVQAINTIKPKTLYPVHTEHPEMFASLGIDPSIKIVLPAVGATYAVGEGLFGNPPTVPEVMTREVGLTQPPATSDTLTPVASPVVEILPKAPARKRAKATAEVKPVKLQAGPTLAVGIEESPAKSLPAKATAARVTRITDKAICVENAAGTSLWIPKSVIVPLEAVPVAPSDAPWAFTVKSWFAKKDEFQAWHGAQRNSE